MVKSGGTKWLMIGTGVLVGAFLLTSLKAVRADDGDDGDSEAPAAASASSHRRGNFARERVNKGDKETDGTTAANRFQAETVIKSQYKLDGEQLEVDPD